MVLDYYNEKEFIQAFEEMKSNPTKYKIDNKGYTYRMLSLLTPKIANDTAETFLENNPNILEYNIEKDLKYIKTTCLIPFKLCIDSKKLAIIEKKDKNLFILFNNVYQGNYKTRCHDISFILSNNYEYVTTAFINSMLEDYKYLHSFIEDGDYVYDFARNLKIKKNIYYSLLNPDIQSKIKGEDVVKNAQIIKDEYPGITPKQYFMEYNELTKKLH